MTLFLHVSLKRAIFLFRYLSLLPPILTSAFSFSVCILFLLAFFGVLYPYNRGALLTSLVLVYALTSVVGGYTSAAFHNQFSETGWVSFSEPLFCCISLAFILFFFLTKTTLAFQKRSVLLAGILYMAPFFVTMSIVNTVAIAQGVTAAIPFGTIVVILLIYFFLAIPLLALGGLIGHCFRSEFSAPCATKQYPREILPLAWYRNAPSQMFIAGLLPFSAIGLQLHHLYASIWGFKIYTLPGILFITFLILVMLTAILSIGLTYIQLSVEDHRWWWRYVALSCTTHLNNKGYSTHLPP